MLDILAIGAHPDDIEIFMGGAICYFKEKGLRVGVCDLTMGEAGTYGSAEERALELKTATEILRLDERITLQFPDGNVRNTETVRLSVINLIRKFRPEVLISFTNGKLRHPDHQYTADIVQECAFLSGLEKVETEHTAFRPSALVQFPELIPIEKPDFVIDITPFWEIKKQSIQAYGSQVTKDKGNELKSKTFIRSARFWEVLEARAVMAGASIGAKYGEPFYSSSPVKITDIMNSFRRI